LAILFTGLAAYGYCKRLQTLLSADS